MKKFVIFTLIIAMAAGAVFAQTANGISVNAWGRGAFAPLAVVGAEQEDGKVEKDKFGDDEKGTFYSGASTSWGWNNNWIRTDFRVNGNADFVGFQVQVSETSSGGIGVCDNAYIWAKPFSNDILKLSVGRFYEDTLRGKVDSDTGFENFVLNPMDGCKIFTRFQASHSDGVFVNSNAPNGYMLSSAPIEGLFIGLLVNGGLFSGGDVGGSSATKMLDAFRFMQAGFGYEIADIGHIRAQWLGGWFGDIGGDKQKYAGIKYDVSPYFLESWASMDWATWGNGITVRSARIEAAFALTAVQNLLIDLGGKFWLPLSDSDSKEKYTRGVDVALGAKYRMEAFQIIAHINSNLGSYYRVDDNDKSAGGISLAVNLLPSYDLDAFTLGGSLGMTVATVGKGYNGEKPDGDAGKATMRFGFGGYAQKGLGSGSVRAGLAYKTASMDGFGAQGSGTFSIPVILEYAFF